MRALSGLSRQLSRQASRSFATALGLATIVMAAAQSIAAPNLEHQRLKFRNDFKSPVEVVEYYCARDASGFVWSGLLDLERRNFTLWKEVPQQDSFYVAKKYEVAESVIGTDTALVEVRYELLAIGDAHGTRMPAPTQEMRVTFEVKRVSGIWKIAKPDPARIAPVVLDSKFPR